MQLSIFEILDKPKIEFSGSTFSAPRDKSRLNAQLMAVKRLMADREWRTCQQIRCLLGLPPDAAVDSRLRDLRKERFGKHIVNSRHISKGLFEYQLILSPLLASA